MKKTNPTIVLNKTNSDGFIDFNSSFDLSEMIKILNKLIDEENY